MPSSYNKGKKKLRKEEFTMIQVNAMGDACPIPVVKTLNAMKELKGAGTVQTLVDNEIAVQNLTRLAESKGCSIETAKLGEKQYRVTITVGEGAELPENADGICTVPAAETPDNTVVVISADHMSEGYQPLGKILLKGYLFALTHQKKPSLVIAFDTTSQALAAETLFTESGLPGRMIPIPSQITAGCGLAWKAEPEQRDALCGALESADIRYSACRILEMF